MTTIYNKLVRDRIPEIIQSEGRKCRTEMMPEAEYRQALLEKLVEEAVEAKNAAPESLASEIADLYEVVDAILASAGIDKASILALQAQKRQSRGGFDRRIKLLDTD